MPSLSRHRARSAAASGTTFRIPAVAAAMLLATMLPAAAQITTNQGALDSLGGGKAPAKGATHHALAKRKTPNKGAHPAAARKPAGHAAAPARPAPSPTIPAAPPPPPVLGPAPVQVPTHAPPPPPPVPVVQSATGSVESLPTGTRIGFGSGSADLNPATMKALGDFADSLKADPTKRAEIEAYGSGAPDDPSTPRRVALSRGLNARAVLINAGIPSTRIYVRAIGLPHDGGSADRVDLRLVGAEKEGVAPTQGAATTAAAPAAGASPPPTPAPGGGQ
ncbi:OmpA family protein [Rhizosaccharibacter radicis]|uniref:OmpA family protein n=1 Tax=Rhizosaccharibacter radicis TaxID=2782605 RepID=A0ABT1VY62_9PROT|nr:OmpA family protein [Acetobacteraceae bacterium KSS12]